MMRHCPGENVEVYEVTGEDLPVLLIKTAIQVEKSKGASWHNLSVNTDDGIVYVVTLYVHT